ncbi:hypothetical protein AgCh_028024 [Apium graveolens]
MPEFQQQQQQQTSAPPAVTFKNFQVVNPPKFKRTPDLVEANAWLKETEKVFDLVGAGIEQKTKFVNYIPKGEANYWWESKRALEGDEFMTWERVAMFELTSYVALVQKAMVIESRSDTSQRERDGKKRKIETLEGGQQHHNFQGLFNKRPEFQVNKNVGFRKPQSGNGGQGDHFQNPNQ